MFNQHFSGWTSAEPCALACIGGFAEHPALPRSGGKDHNGFSHQDPIHRSGDQQEVERHPHLPAPDANTLLVVADHCLRSTDCINVIVADQQHLQFTSIDGRSSTAPRASASGRGPATMMASSRMVMACCGDVATQETLAATAILRERFA